MIPKTGATKPPYLLAVILMVAACGPSPDVLPRANSSPEAPRISPSATRISTATPRPTPEATASVATLAPLPAGSRFQIGRMTMFDALRGWALGGALGEDPFRPSHVLKTEDGGLTWVDFTPPDPISTSAERLWTDAFFLDSQTAWVIYPKIDPDGDVLRGTPGHIWQTRDGGRTWDRSFDFGGGYRLYSEGDYRLEFVDPSHGWLWTSVHWVQLSTSSSLHRSTDGGRTWDYELGPEEQYFDELGCCGEVLDFVDPLHGVAVAISWHGGPASYWTTDGGVTWQRREMEVPEGTDYCLGRDGRLFTTGHAVVAVRCHSDSYGASTLIYTTRNAGRSWDVIPIQASVARVAVASSTSIYFLGTTGPNSEQLNGLFHSPDGGRTWTRIGSLPEVGSLILVQGQPGWLIGGRDQGSDARSERIYRSQDRGRTWEEVFPQMAAAQDPAPRLAWAPPTFQLPLDLPPIRPTNVAGLRVLDEVEVEDPTALAVDWEDANVAVGTAQGQVFEWLMISDSDGLRGSYPALLPGAEDWIYSLAYVQDDRIILGSRDGSFGVLERYYEPYDHIEFPGGEVTVVVSGGYFGGQNGIPQLPLSDTHAGWVWALALSADERLLAYGGDRRYVGIIELGVDDWGEGAFSVVNQLEGHTSTISDLAFSPDGQILASASWDGKVRLWDVATWTEIRRLEGHDDWVLQIAFSPAGDLLASSSADGTVVLWDVETGEALRFLEHGGPVRGVEFFPDGTLLVTISDDERLRFWGLDS
jgi:photosystem II stability/assembly factor-like uncharacterized protein